jgi:hypothetical protein
MLIVVRPNEGRNGDPELGQSDRMCEKIASGTRKNCLQYEKNCLKYWTSAVAENGAFGKERPYALGYTVLRFNAKPLPDHLAIKPSTRENRAVWGAPASGTSKRKPMSVLAGLRWFLLRGPAAVRCVSCGSRQHVANGKDAKGIILTESADSHCRKSSASTPHFYQVLQRHY